MNEQASSTITRGDRISFLPDEIISVILSNLSVEESARTSILSKRWHKLWLLSPITISDKSIMKQSRTYSNQEESGYSSWIINTLSHIISTHPGPIHTCHFILPIWDDRHQTLVNLLRTLTQKGIQNLQIYCEYDLFEVPNFVLKCTSLIEVELWCGRIFSQSETGREIFPNVRKLTMVLCYVNHDFFINLLASKSVVELKLSACYGLEDVVIDSDSLQKLSFSIGEHISSTELIVKDAPNLESFNYYDLTSNCKVVVLNAPKLKVLGCIDMKILMFKLGNYWFKFHKKHMEIGGEITYMPSLLSLNIKVDFSRGYEAKSIPQFLLCFPCLETLKVKVSEDKDTYYSSDGFSDNDSSDDEHNDDDNDDNDDDDLVIADSNAAVVVGNDYDFYVDSTSNINCLNHHLKYLRIENYCGKQAYLDFVGRIVEKARVLEKVTIVYNEVFEENSIKAHAHFLLRSKASKMLKVEFHEKR